ncbi:hypothetical protein HYG87_02205 [Methanobacterium alkalithermotolerans]|uniref:Uncharacterized protein n=1 Tax=Methanobacterium alkalithermotolerans TaxID=2731220 RepID=A0A8T8K587_9EURY|nr:hypothetical protein [Methanobacterium alkalithermotolerans]QUH22665.1 hypothetical protein HYG87_02205 [Methanobacterium alkalithermotolerans]
MEPGVKLSQLRRKTLFKYNYYFSRISTTIYQSPLYDYYLKNPLSSWRIHTRQKYLMEQEFEPDLKELIIFLTPGYDDISGGILSISSICTETDKLFSSPSSGAMICNLPGDPPLLKYTRFSNNHHLYNFSQALDYFPHLEELIIHIPEFAIGQFIINLTPGDRAAFKKLKKLHINLLLQNIDYLPPLKEINALKKLGFLSCTTAHEQYSTRKMQEYLGCPLHKLSVFISPENYNRKPFSQRDDLMIISPDPHPLKSRVLDKLTENLPDLKLQIIENLSYEEFKELISGTKWALTFGEGLDGYFVETVFSGGIGFSVYNEQFFTPDFQKLKTVYPSYPSLLDNMVNDIKAMDNQEDYQEYQEHEYRLCTEYWDYQDYLQNLKLFYQGEYTYDVK